MEKNYEKNNNLKKELQILQKYFRFHLSSLHKLTSEPEKFKKFREKWNDFATISDKRNPLEEERDKAEKNQNSINRRHTTINPNSRFKINENFFKIKEDKSDNFNNQVTVTIKNNKENNSSINVQKIIEKESTNTITKPKKSSTQKNFICLGGYGAIKKALLERGWIENQDQESLDFDMKWTLKTKDIPAASYMRKEQIVNHYLNNIEITKKSGLAKNLRNMIFRNIDINNFYPRSYELSERNEFEDFLEDFKGTKALSLLMQFNSGLRADISEGVLKAAVLICERRMNWFDSINKDLVENLPNEISNEFFIDLLKNLKIQKLISDKEWCAISEEDTKNYAKEIEKLEKMNKIGYLKVERKSTTSVRKESNLIPQFDNNEICSASNSEDQIDLIDKYKIVISKLLSKIEKLYPQFNLNGNRNIWILKPSGLSRGRGIVCLNNLNEIFNLIKRNSNQYIAQKYIENPMIILGRKFDIRQWVLVTDLNPLTIWMYDTPYVRFGAEDYKLEEFDNLFSHLTNNSVVKYSKNFSNMKIEGNMWDSQQFSAHLKEVYGRDVWKEEIQEKIRKIIVCSLESARRNFKYRKNSHELYGYDIMIDDQLNVWLIEVNSSPAMDYSTPITERLVKQMSEDLVKVVVDYNSADDSQKEKVSTGMFTKIYEGEEEVNIDYLPNN